MERPDGDGNGEQIDAEQSFAMEFGNFSSDKLWIGQTLDWTKLRLGGDTEKEAMMARPGGATEEHTTMELGYLGFKMENNTEEEQVTKIKHVPPAEHFTTFHERIYQEKQKLLNIGKVLYLSRRNKYDCKGNGITDGALHRNLQQINWTQNRWNSVQKFIENYNNLTNNTRKYWVKPVRRNVTDKMGQRKNRTKIVKPAIATLLHGSQRLFVYMIHSVTDG